MRRHQIFPKEGLVTLVAISTESSLKEKKMFYKAMSKFY